MSEYPVGTTATAMRVVEALLARGEAGVTELAAELDLSKGAVHNHLRTLTELGYVVRSDGRYRVGTGFLDLGTRAREQLPIYDTARPEVAALARASGEVAALVVEEHGQAAYVLVVGDEDDETSLRPGLRRPLHADAAGKAILAHRPEGETRDLLAGRDHAPETEQSALFEEFRAVRKQGVAFDRGEGETSLGSVAAPVTDEDGHAIGAVAVAGPSDRMSGKRLEEDVTGLIVSSATSISVDLF